MAFKLCFSTLGCPDLGLEQAIALAQTWALDGIEIRALGGTLDIAKHLQQEYGTAAALAKRMCATPIRIAALDSGMHMSAPDATGRQEVLELAHWADALNVAHIRVFDGNAQDGENHTHALNRIHNTLQWWQSQRAQYHFRCDLMLETHWLLAAPMRCAAFLRDSPLPVNLLWDSFHTWNKSPMPLPEVWQRIGHCVRHIHFKDGCKTNSGGGLPQRYTLPAKGDFPLADLFALLRRNAFSGWLSLEWERMWVPELPALEDALSCWRNLGFGR